MNLATGMSNLILYYEIADGDPKDSTLYVTHRLHPSPYPVAESHNRLQPDLKPPHSTVLHKKRLLSILKTRRKERAMSIESARLFMERMKKDEEFRNRVIAGEDNEARLKLVKSEGFDFTKDEFLAVHGELSDAELEKVGGGVTPGCHTMFIAYDARWVA